MVGPRRKAEREEGNLLVMLAGAGILWIGWTGRFNGGDPFSDNTDSSVAVLNTNVCLDLLRRRRSRKTVRGGLMGVGAVPWYTMDVLCLNNKVDDTLGVQAGGAQIKASRRRVLRRRMERDGHVDGLDPDQGVPAVEDDRRGADRRRLRDTWGDGV